MKKGNVRGRCLFSFISRIYLYTGSFRRITAVTPSKSAA